VIAQGLLATDPAAIADAEAREYRAFCERAGGDLEALAACMLRPRLSFAAEELKLVPHPVLVVCGEDDAASGRPEPLAQAFGDGHAQLVPRRNHHSTVGDRVFKEAVRDFLDAAA
jgi:pimeloyl-ACP methyl ester carboxylesterase